LIAQNPYAMGYLGVEYAWKLLEGENFDPDVWVDTATTIVTRENMFSAESQKALFSFG
jgi:ribose transport system substrate-binding protein